MVTDCKVIIHTDEVCFDSGEEKEWEINERSTLFSIQQWVFDQGDLSVDEGQPHVG